jgi:uncharacterized iron-regulated membrane protein
VLLFIVAFTAVSLNLNREVFLPLISTVSTVTPTPFDTRSRATVHEPITPRIDYAGVMERARREAAQRGWDMPIGGMFYTPSFGIYGAQFFHEGADHGTGGVGHATIYIDAVDGTVLGDRRPWQGTVADIFVQAQFPLHSGRILGLPGRILISIMGLVVAMLSVTGVYIWWKKRRAQLRQQARIAQGVASQPVSKPDPSGHDMGVPGTA